MLSSIGGTLRLGELVHGGVIRHALKVNLYSKDDYWYDSVPKGFWWPAKILAKAFQDYGAYTADDTAWSVYGIATEFSLQGRGEDEFLQVWGFVIDPSARTSHGRGTWAGSSAR